MIVKNYMAIIRNLRNVLNANVSDHYLDKIVNAIKDKNAIRKSKQFPFRFFSAYREIDNQNSQRAFLYEIDNKQKINHPRTSEVLDALEEAISISYNNIPHLPGTTLIACDVSGSMEHTISRHSRLERYDVGLLLGASVHKYTDKGIIGIFGDKWKQINLAKLSSGIIANTIKMHEKEGEVGYSTNGYLVIQWAINNNLNVDRFLFFTDNQMWNSRYGDLISGRDMIEINDVFKEYKKQVNPNSKMYVFDLAGYGTMAFPPNNPSIVGIAGWSDKIFNFINIYEKGAESQVNYIKNKF